MISTQIWGRERRMIFIKYLSKYMIFIEYLSDGLQGPQGYPLALGSSYQLYLLILPSPIMSHFPSYSLPLTIISMISPKVLRGISIHLSWFEKNHDAICDMGSMTQYVTPMIQSIMSDWNTVSP